MTDSNKESKFQPGFSHFDFFLIYLVILYGSFTVYLAILISPLINFDQTLTRIGLTMMFNGPGAFYVSAIKDRNLLMIASWDKFAGYIENLVDELSTTRNVGTSSSYSDGKKKSILVLIEEKIDHLESHFEPVGVVGKLQTSVGNLETSVGNLETHFEPEGMVDILSSDVSELKCNVINILDLLRKQNESNLIDVTDRPAKKRQKLHR